ncbi:MAG TPA: hypothetical protein VIA81_00940 [Acidimicrobiia bacterium]
MQGMIGDQETGRSRPWLGVAIALLVLLMLFVAEVATSTDVESDLGIAVSIVLVGLISGVLVARRPGHPVSWLLAAAAMAGGFAGVSAEGLPRGLTELSGWQAFLAIVGGPTWYALLFLVLVLLPLLFPTGSPLSPGWQWVGWLGGASLSVMSFLWATQDSFCSDPSDEGCRVVADNPIGITGIGNPEESFMGEVFYGLMLICAVAALVSLVLRYLRADPVQRHQIKWVGYALGLFFVFTLGVDVIWVGALGGDEPPGYGVIQQLLWVLIPASIAVAILRYRLYDIDRIVSRTVSYAVVALVLAAVYVGGVIGVQAVLPASNDLAVAASTLLVAALFTPLRRRVQRWVDRRFNRSRYDAAAIVEAFSTRLRDAVDLSAVTRDLGAVVERTMQPVMANVWVRSDAGS